jgi:hypothetical protein
MKYIITLFTDYPSDTVKYRAEVDDISYLESIAYHEAEDNWYDSGGYPALLEELQSERDWLDENSEEIESIAEDRINTDPPFGYTIDVYDSNTHGDWGDYSDII